MRKKRDLYEDPPSRACRGRVLARILAEDLRFVQGCDFQSFFAAARTDPPPGFDVTFAGADNSF
jgi:hypothetical protein